MRARREPKYNAKPKKPQHVFFHVFAQTTHVVAAPHGFACVGIPATLLYIPSFIEIRSRVSEPQGVKIWLFPLLWLVAFTTACTTVQAVTSKCTAEARVRSNRERCSTAEMLWNRTVLVRFYPLVRDAAC